VCVGLNLTCSMSQQQRVCRPIASTDHTAGPLAALISALSAGGNQGHFSTNNNKDARFTAQLCSALNLQSNSLYANMQRGLAASSPKVPFLFGALPYGLINPAFQAKRPPLFASPLPSNLPKEVPVVRG